MEQFNLPVPEIDAVFLTHFHNDHIADIGEVMQRSFIMGRAKELTIYGPTGAEQLVNGFIDVYDQDGVVVATSHPPIDPAFGYTIEFAGKMVVISGDTLITDELKRNSQGADLVVMDVMNYEFVEAIETALRAAGDERNATIFYDIREYHPDVSDIGVFATEHDVARLALTHYAPSAQTRRQLRRVYVNPIKAEYDGEIIAGSDDTTVVIPLD